ncbi:hypothetical protein GTO89_09580 [Heliobacterium gestii]|uniref:Uncharacterized protein n=1 Tax=Heliomicrobium gestii TaxID=2699 RepID=A0A845LAQ9_HELGE|nr:hypothetical protein [Heliomicrobium gestii]MBM7867900.1 hypothetical protein [Heliomicrobium gestii]MZP43288.1 hypothetical protein [Heliomicrobium gestii]
MASINLLPGALRLNRRGLLRRIILSMALWMLAGAVLYMGAVKCVDDLIDKADAAEKAAVDLQANLAIEQAKGEENGLAGKEAAFLTAMLWEKPSWSKRLSGLEGAFPEEPLHLTAMLMEGGERGAVILEGESNRLYTVSEFMDGLKGRAGFSEISLLEGAYGAGGDVRFRLLCRVPDAAPLPNVVPLSPNGGAGKGGLNHGGPP